MSFNVVRKLPSPQEVVDMIPLSEQLKKIKCERDIELKKIMSGESDKFLVIIGPCSANDEDPVCDYVYRLAKLQEELSDKIFIVPRIYTNKPRTTGEGYKGMLHQPDPERETNILNGILAIRKMHFRAISESHLTSADEMLYPENHPYVEDMLSYVAIGARSVENQQHRLVCSGIDMPAGMKNPTSGDLTVMFNSIFAAQCRHTFLYKENEVNTSGNDYCHAILRGSVNSHGESIPNYHYEDLKYTTNLYLKKGYKNPFVVVDANHANSKKIYSEQPRIVKEVLSSRKYNSEIAKIVRGLMIESYIEEGSQSVNEHVYGKSITDACIGWDETKKLLYFIAENI